MPRTNAELVKAVLLDDYGPRANGQLPSLTPSIGWASLIVDRVAVKAVAKGRPLTTDELLQIETWLAAYCHTGSDATYTQRSSGKASGSFLRDQGEDANPYKARAVMLDTSGCLTAILKRQRAGVTWGGLAQSDQLSWEERNGTPGE